MMMTASCRRPGRRIANASPTDAGSVISTREGTTRRCRMREMSAWSGRTAIERLLLRDKRMRVRSDRRKREGGEDIPRAELEVRLSGAMSAAKCHYQVAAWLMAVCWRGIAAPDAGSHAHPGDGR